MSSADNTSLACGMNEMIREIKTDLKADAKPEKAEFFPRFFKTGKGEYGEGDRFWGVMVPDCRRVAKRHARVSLATALKLLKDPIHECRLTALFILIHQYQRGDEAQKSAIIDAYLEHLDYVNNWDLVDASAEKLLGRHLESRSRRLLDQLSQTDHLWRQRVSIIACLHFIKLGDFDDLIRISKRLLDHPHDLIHKAIGWMLREMGKRDESALRLFLLENGADMPRTALRYAIERFDRSERDRFLAGDFSIKTRRKK